MEYEVDEKIILREGRWIDAAILLVLTKRLLTPLNKTDAYKLGLIDKKGKKIKDPVTPKEKDAFSMLNRLIIKIKRLLGTVGIAALGAFLVFLKEENESKIAGTSKESLMEEINWENKMEDFDLKCEALFETQDINREEYYKWKLAQQQKEHLKEINAGY